MERSMQEVEARLAEAAAAARAERVRRALGLDGLKVTLPDDFDDPAFSRQVLGLDE